MTRLVWAKSLRRLNLSHNFIKTISTSICHLPNIQHLNLSYNCIKTLPPPSNWKCKMLAKLNLSYNEVRTYSPLLLPHDVSGYGDASNKQPRRFLIF